MYKSFFFFSSRRRHTRLTCDWSSDVCSSDLIFYKATFASCIAQCVLDVPGYTLGNEICIMHKTIGRLDEYRSEEHTSELQSHVNLVCRLLLEKKKKKKIQITIYINVIF